jgi:hypothetical protein
VAVWPVEVRVDQVVEDPAVEDPAVGVEADSAAVVLVGAVETREAVTA